MKNNNKYTVIILLLIVFASCKKSFETLSKNPNKPSEVPASLLLNGVLNDIYDAPYTMQERWCQYYCCNYDYYGNNRYDFGSQDDYYNTLNNVNKMEAAALATGGETINPYEALGNFFRAYMFTKMSLEYGDIPVDDALKGLSNLQPAYNTQKEVFIKAFGWLEKANTDLSQLIANPSSNTTNGQVLKGDIYFNNDLAKWQKAVNTLHLRLLLACSMKADDAGLNIKTQFNTIVNNPDKYPVMENSGDNLQYTYIHPTNDYPMNPSNFGFDALRYNTSATYISLLTKLRDPRVFVTAEPAIALVKGNVKPTDFEAFAGADPGEDQGVMYVKTNSGNYSLINRHHFYETYTGEPSIQIGYPELCFNIAEAISRGWINKGPLGAAEDYYKAGIISSMDFYGVPVSGSFTAYFLKPGASLGTSNTYTIDVNFDNYYAQPLVKYAGNNTNGLTQILQQKYLALFRHSGLESYFTWRRTGVPAFTTGTGTGNSERIALRFQYPGNEKTANATNYNAALQAQYGGNDDINAKMWLLK